MLDVALPSIQPLNFDFIDVNAQNVEADRVITQHQRQPNISEPHNTDQGCFTLKLLNRLLSDIHHIARTTLLYYPPAQMTGGGVLKISISSYDGMNPAETVLAAQSSDPP
ncbi:hypothetical protein D3C76_811010 [compost metagenome]